MYSSNKLCRDEYVVLSAVLNKAVEYFSFLIFFELSVNYITKILFIKHLYKSVFSFCNVFRVYKKIPSLFYMKLFLSTIY